VKLFYRDIYDLVSQVVVMGWLVSYIRSIRAINGEKMHKWSHQFQFKTCLPTGKGLIQPTGAAWLSP